MLLCLISEIGMISLCNKYTDGVPIKSIHFFVCFRTISHTSTVKDRNERRHVINGLGWEREFKKGKKCK